MNDLIDGELPRWENAITPHLRRNQIGCSQDKFGSAPEASAYAQEGLLDWSPEYEFFTGTHFLPQRLKSLKAAYRKDLSAGLSQSPDVEQSSGPDWIEAVSGNLRVIVNENNHIQPIVANSTQPASQSTGQQSLQSSAIRDHLETQPNLSGTEATFGDIRVTMVDGTSRDESLKANAGDGNRAYLLSICSN